MFDVLMLTLDIQHSMFDVPCWCLMLNAWHSHSMFWCSLFDVLMFDICCLTLTVDVWWWYLLFPIHVRCSMVNAHRFIVWCSLFSIWIWRLIFDILCLTFGAFAIDVCHFPVPSTCSTPQPPCESGSQQREGGFRVVFGCGPFCVHFPHHRWWYGH